MPAAASVATSESMALLVAYREHRPIIVALISSVVLHVLILARLESSFLAPQGPTATPATNPVELRILRQHADAEPALPNAVQAPTLAPAPLTSGTELDEPAAAVDALQGENAQSAPVEGAATAIASPRALITTLPTDLFDAPQYQYSCSVQDQRSEVRRCASSNHALDMALRSGRFYGAFKRTFASLSPDTTLHQDLAKIDALLEEHKTLQTLAENEGINLSDVLQAQRRVSREIDRIDDKYASFDLIKILVTGSRLTGELAKVVKEKVE